jgi:pimeloyl-ACP methyl ester carboxylesterase
MKNSRKVAAAKRRFRCAVLTVLATTSLAACGNPPYPRGSTEDLFAGSDLPTLSQQVVAGERINMASTPGDKSGPAGTKPMLLFVHGSPGDWKAWSYYLKTPALAGFAKRIAIDRPGFGGSGKGQVVTDLRQQAALIAKLIPDGQKVIVVGHSLGGPLAVWMAIDAPDKVCGAVSIAGSLSSRYEKPRWYNLLADSALLSWAVPDEMLWSNREMMPLSGELEKLEAAAPQLHIPLTLLQGEKDSLVEPKSVDEFAKRAPTAWLTIKKLPGETHFVLWEKPQIIVDAIKDLPCASSS